jgi:hypothetical protein
MRDIGLDHAPSSAFPFNTFLVYGETRSGKSEFGATFPRPLIIVDVGERGYETIQKMDRSKWWEPNVMPIMKGIDNMGDIANIVTFAQPLIATGRILSIVFDAFSFYADFYLAKLNELMPNADNRQIYGKLGTHLQYVRNALHQLPVNVVWNCLAAAPETSENGISKNGMPLIPGSQGPKFGAGVSYLMYSRLAQKREGGKVVAEQFELRTKQYNSYAAGSRLGMNALPDPFIMGTYRDLAPHLGFDVDAMYRAMKPITGAVARPASTAPVKPPVAQTKPVVQQRTIVRSNNVAPKAVTPTGK